MLNPRKIMISQEVYSLCKDSGISKLILLMSSFSLTSAMDKFDLFALRMAKFTMHSLDETCCPYTS